jgi:sarcosine oxidase gamma subunit
MIKRKFLLILATVLTCAVSASPAAAALTNQRTDMKVLLLSATGDEPSALAWEASLKREGVPYDKMVLKGDRPALTAETFADTLADGTPHAKYEGVVVATGGLVYESNGSYVSALSPDEWNLLAQFEATYGIRQVTASVYPGAAYGLNSPSFSGDVSGGNMTLTTAGKTVFPQLVGTVPIDSGSWGYYTTPLSSYAPGESFTSLLSVSGGRTVMGVYKHADGREELVFTIDSNQFQLHSLLLSHGLVSWLTNGKFFGYDRNYLAMQVDDLFLSNDVWNVTTNTTGTSTVRMKPIDVTQTGLWSLARGIRLDFAFNGEGNIDAGGTTDSLLRYIKLFKNDFGFVNHTYGHINLDDVDDDPSNGLTPADLSTIEDQISQNITWAKSNGIPIRASELVTGGHSGVHDNPYFAQAVTDTGIAWTGDDNSRYPSQERVGSALTVPRYPTNVYYNASTRAQQLDEYNYIYLPPSLGGSCVDTLVTTCLSAPVTWQQYVTAEGNAIVRHMLINDPRPHFAHQSNLTGDRILLTVLDKAITQYRTYVKSPIVQPTLTDAGVAIQRDDFWNSVNSDVIGFVQNGTISISSSVLLPVSVPITGSTSIGSIQDGQRSGWVTVQPGQTVQLTAAP